MSGVRLQVYTFLLLSYYYVVFSTRLMISSSLVSFEKEIMTCPKFDSLFNIYDSPYLPQQIGGKMSNSSAGPSSKVRVGSSQPSETTFKRKRGVFQKDCGCLLLFCALKRFSLRSSHLYSISLWCSSAAHDVRFWGWS